MDLVDFVLDSDFNRITDLKWLPFVGKEYFNQLDRLLIVGESHYLPVDEDEALYLRKEWTREFIYKEGLQIQPYYINTSKNKLISNVEKTINIFDPNFSWDNACYFNLIQRLLPSIQGKDRPVYHDYIFGLRVFSKLLPLLKPKMVLFCGIEASKHIKGVFEGEKIQINDIYTPDEKINGSYPKVFEIKQDNIDCKVYFVRHPSRYYSSEKWGHFISKH